MTTPFALMMVRSDAGDGGWSLHLSAADTKIASGDAPALLTGPAQWDDAAQEWDRPDAADYFAAAGK
jgi:hypothetical protein